MVKQKQFANLKEFSLAATYHYFCHVFTLPWQTLVSPSQLPPMLQRALTPARDGCRTMTAHTASAAVHTRLVESTNVYENSDEVTLLLLLEYDELATNLA